MRSVCLFVVISTIFNLAKSDINQYSKTVSHKMPCNSLSEISKDLLLCKMTEKSMYKKH